ncbi:MAG: sulfotransferase [Acidobacteria bacterium]|nr:sulfotransferase [Acidobacteriota bacterium]
MKEEAEESIIIVSGLPRSGTSMMMRMLEAGGINVLTDGIRKADEDNPEGYYEVELVKTLKQQSDKLWLGDARGKAVKVISALLDTLPQSYRYKVIFMNRNLAEVIASQNKMRARKGDHSESSDEEMSRLFQLRR